MKNFFNHLISFLILPQPIPKFCHRLPLVSLKNFYNNKKVTNIYSTKLFIHNSIRKIHTSLNNENSSLNPWFLTGFSDGESSFKILVKKSLTHKNGWQIIANFRIELHVKDLELLKSIQKFFNGIGQVGLVSTRKLAYFEVTKLNDLVNIIIPHFDKHPLQSAKSLDYLLWKECVNIMLTKEHLNQAGLEKIISIKSAINWGNSPNLKDSFPNVKPVERPKFKVSENPLNPHWVTGFSEGESSFYVSILSKKKEVQTGFAIRLNERDKPLLVKIQSFFNGIGNINHQSSDNTSIFKITKRINLIETIVPHFNTYELFGNKKPNFLIWSQILSLINERAHLTTEGLDKIKKLKDQLNKWD